VFVQDHLMAEKFQKLERLQTGRGVGQAVSDHHLGDRRMDRAGDRHDRRSPLTPEQEQQGRERIDGGPLPDDKVCSLRGADIKIILENEFDVCRSLSATDDLLHRLGYSCLQPRPEHDKCDEMICDGRGFHTGKRVIVPENVALIVLPPYSAELNPVENLWHSLTSHY